MVDIAALATELAKPAYNGLSDAAAVVALHAIAEADTPSITGSDLRRALIFTTNNDWGKLIGVADGWITAGVTAAIRLRAAQMRELFLTDAPFDTAKAAQYTQLLAAVDQLITDGIMSGGGKSALTALASTTRRPWADVTQYDVWVARGQPA